MRQSGAVLATHPRSEGVKASPTPILSTVAVDPVHDISPPVGNTHSMITRAKARVFKPKVLNDELQDHEPRNINEAFASLEWTKAA